MNKNRNPVSIGVLAGLSLVIGGASTPASALMMSDSEFFSVFSSVNETDSSENDGSVMGDDPQMTSVSLDQFDPALGTLTGVTFSLSSGLQEAGLFLTVNTLGEFAEGSVEGTLEQTVVDTVTNMDLFDDSDTQSADCLNDSSQGCNNGAIFNNILDDSLGVPIDPGYSGVGTFDIELFLTALVEVNLTEGESANGSAQAGWEGIVTVEYTFDEPQPVPEPVVLTLLGAGLGGLAAVRRRKRSR